MNQSTPYIPPEVSSGQAAAWLILTVVIFLAWWSFFAKKYSSEFTIAERILASFMSTVSQIVGSTLILGIGHWVYWWPIFIVNMIINLALLAWAFKERSGHNLLREVVFTVKAAWSLLISSSALFVIAVISLMTAGCIIYLGQLLPPFCWDAWSYHLPWAAYAHQEGHLGPFNQPCPWVNIFPKNTDILFLWWIMGTGSDRLANIAQAPFAFAAALSCYVLARRVGARQVDAAIGGMLVFSVPVVVNMMWLSMVDLAWMGAALVSLAFLSHRRLSSTALVLAGLGAGFAIGTKATFIFMYIGLLFFLIYRLLPIGMNALTDYRGNRLKGFATALVIFVIVSFVFGSYFYLRNWVQTGNPTAIYKIQVGSLVVFDGELSPSFHQNRQHTGPKLFDALQENEWPVIVDGFFDPNERFSISPRIGGWGPPWGIILLPAIPIALGIAVVRKRWNLIATLFSLALPFLIYPYNRTELRYHLQLIGMGTVAFAFILSLLRNSGYRRTILALTIVLMIASSLFIVDYGQVGGDINSEWIISARSEPYLEQDRYMYFNIFWNQRKEYDAWEAVQEPGSILAYQFDGSPPPFHFRKMLAMWNSTYTNRAVYVPWGGDGIAWEDTLRESQADSIYIEGVEATNWALNHPENFKQLILARNRGVFDLIWETE